MDEADSDQQESDHGLSLPGPSNPSVTHPTWESPLKFTSSKKRQKLCIDFNKCAVCQETSTKEKLIKGTSAGVKSIIEATTVRRDQLYSSLISEFGDLNKQ